MWTDGTVTRSPGVCRYFPERCPPPVPVPREAWPAWATWIAGHREPGEIGVGSTVERMLGKGGRAFKATFAAFGVDCGCSSRRDRWDAEYAYGD